MYLIRTILAKGRHIVGTLRCFADLRLVSERQQVPIELEPYVKKLNNARRRLMLVNNILQNAQVTLSNLANAL